MACKVVGLEMQRSKGYIPRTRVALSPPLHLLSVQEKAAVPGKNGGGLEELEERIGAKILHRLSGCVSGTRS